MIKYNIKLFFRSVKKYKSSFLINSIGLSTGLACVLLIYLWVHDEMNIDKFHEKDSLLYQVLENSPGSDGITTIPYTPGLLAKTLSEEMPEIEFATSVLEPSWFEGIQGIITIGKDHFKAAPQMVDKSYFNVFSWNLIHGDKHQVIGDKSAVILSDKLAVKLFGSTENSVGKTIEWEHEEFNGLFNVTGVFEKPSKNSSAQFDILFSYEKYFDDNISSLGKWENGGPETYVVLKKGTNVNTFNNKIQNLRKEKHIQFESGKSLEYMGTFFLQKYSDRHLYNHFENGIQSGGRIEYVNIFSIIAFFILMIACINFMNLSTAKASRRLKEIGIKKVVGANRKTLVFQFLVESVTLVFLSLIIALLLVALFLPEFNIITGKQLSLNLSFNLWMSVIAIVLITGLFSGSYPALYLSKFKPVIVLKGKLRPSLGETWTRKGLVIFQFSISVILIMSVLVINKQIKFIHTKNLGYNKDNIIVFQKEGKLNKNLETFLQGLKNISGVINTSTNEHDLVGNHGSTGGLSWEGKKPDERINFVKLEQGYDWIELMGVEMAEGRSYSREFGDEESKIILNEAAIAIMGIENPIGKTVNIYGKEKQIIGVTKNFHFESLYQEIKPCFFQFHSELPNILVKIKGGVEKETLGRIEDFYKEYNDGLPFNYKFIDEDFQALYASEQQISSLSQYFSAIAILISCLGLFGLAAFTAEQRKKEIGIRKILGSSVFNIIKMLTGEFSKMVFIALFIALPLGYWGSSKWLGNFAYRIDLEWWMFAGAGLGVILIALATVSLQAIKAACANPIKSLKTE